MTRAPCWRQVLLHNIAPAADIEAKRRHPRPFLHSWNRLLSVRPHPIVGNSNFLVKLPRSHQSQRRFQHVHSMHPSAWGVGEGGRLFTVYAVCMFFATLLTITAKKALRNVRYTIESIRCDNSLFLIATHPNGARHSPG